MFDNALYALIRSTMLDNLGAAGIDTVVTDVVQSAQPMQQGANSRPTVYFYKLYDTPVGTPKRNSQYQVLPASLQDQAVLTDEAGESLATESLALLGLDDQNAIAANISYLLPQIMGEDGRSLTGQNGILLTADQVVSLTLVSESGSVLTDQLGDLLVGEGSVASPQEVPLITLENGLILGQEIPSSQYGMVYTQTQRLTSTFQVMALVPQDVANVGSYTASDIVNLVAGIMQSDIVIQKFEAVGVGVLRVAQVRNPVFENDRSQFEASPSFDFVLTHKQDIVTAAPSVTAIKVQVLRV